mmetsp:Transcript_54532/g.160371  ORF Transcript_54532/g.160371 Transcript_54532/m.160371 type:complete len:128 (+) Transcript_54532:78-461(+)
MDEFKGSPTAMVADVDCTTEGKSLCEKFAVSGYPTIKYGDPAEMKDYNGGRTMADLKKFASENLGPTCGPGNLDLCDEKARKKIEGYMAMPGDKLDAKIEKAINSFEKDVPVMKKVMGHLKAKKTDL